jgi:hypothetical protein
MSGPRVLLMTLSERTSTRGTAYMSGFLGRARVVAFKAKEPDKYGNKQWELDVHEPPAKNDSDQAPRHPAARGQRTWDKARQTPDGFVEAWSQPPESTPFLDDTETAVADLRGRDR